MQFEMLESRCLLAAASLVEQQFRADDFSIAGSFTFELQRPDNNNFRDWVPNGTYSSTAGHLAWTSPQAGTGFIEGQASGAGTSTFVYGGRTYTATTYTLAESGRFDFSLDASLKQLQMATAQATSTHYTSYVDKHPLGQDFPQSVPAPSHFWGGVETAYTGTFDPATQQVSINYSTDPPPTTATSPPATLQWANQAATDMALTVTAASVPTPPAGWVTLPPTSTLAAGIDLSQGLDLTVNVTGKPVKTATVLQPVATVRLFWATSATDMSGVEIPVTPQAGSLGVYWNSAQLHAVVTQFPARPAGAAFLRVTLDAVSGADANAANNTRFVAIYQAHSDTTGPVSEDSLLDGQAASVLAAADAAEGNIQVQAYAPRSSLGATLQVLNQAGGYRYDPTTAPQLQALAQGETAQDVVQFLAVKNGAAGSLATRTINVTGVNDSPVAGADSGAAKSYGMLLLSVETLLSNDTDVDHNDALAVTSVASMSPRGATIRTVQDGQGKIVQVEYDPTTSSQLQGLVAGQQLSDEFSYEIADLQGARATGQVLIRVTGQPLSLNHVAPQCTTSNQATAPISIVVTDPDGAAASFAWSSQAAVPSLIPAANLQLSGTGSQRQLVITPLAGATGRTQIQVTVSDNLGRSAVLSFLLVVGSAQDLDLDGVSDAVENAGPQAGDMNGDQVPDSRQPQVASLPGQGGSYVNLVAPEPQAFSTVSVATSPAPSGPAANTQFPLGLLYFELFVDSPGALGTATLRTDLAEPPLNRFYQYQEPAAGGTGWQNLMENGVAGARVFANRMEIRLRDGGRGDQSPLSDGRIVVGGAPGHVAHPWQNDQPLDVNNDGIILPVDALILIAQYNLGRGGSLSALPQGTDSFPPFLDTSGDDYFAPVDVLGVINYLNIVSAGEGEAAVPGSALLVADTSVNRLLAATAPAGNDDEQLGQPGPASDLFGGATAASLEFTGVATTSGEEGDWAADVDALLTELGGL